MWKLLSLFVLGAGAYVVSRQSSAPAEPRRAAFAPDQPQDEPHPVRDSGPDAMRDPPRAGWSAADEASDQSFPASDPPATY